MTLHAAKGLEFDYVFLPGWEENLFPHPRCMQDNGAAGLEEERRLAYVGISRAKVKAMISYALQRRTYQGWQVGIPSRFLKELPTCHVKHIQANNHEVKQHGYSSKTASIEDYRALHLKIGDRVFHQKFGYGDVVDTEIEQATVEFDMSDTKKIHISFLKKQ